jgi:hypothetical protein
MGPTGQERSLGKRANKMDPTEYKKKKEELIFEI